MDAELQQVIDRALRELVDRLAGEEHLQAEQERARRVFLGATGARSVAGRGIAEAADRRFFEWFALERESEVLGGVPLGVPRFAVDEALMGSCVGVFLVESVSDGLAMARDLQDDTLLELTGPRAALARGDLVVGRLFPAGVGRWLPSIAATVFRPGAALATAFVRDVRRLELGRRLQQIELEHLLLRRGEGVVGGGPEAGGDKLPPLEHLEADLDKLLGVGALSATEISARLAGAERLGQVMGPLLDQLAFESEADLDAARTVLLQIWNVHHGRSAGEVASAAPEQAGDEPAEGRSDETLGERLVRRLDEGLRQHQDVEEVFADLEQLAGLEPGAADDAANPFDAAPDDDGAAGTLGPLVEEYLWETGQSDGDVARTLRTWVGLQANAALPRCDLEDVAGLDLMRLLLHVYLAAGPDERVDRVRAGYEALRAFLAWAETTQELAFGAVLEECQAGLIDDLQRLGEAGQALSHGAVPAGRPALLEVVDVAADGFGLCGEEGGDFWVPAAAATTALLRVGDLVLGAMVGRDSERAFAGPVVVLPHRARKLME